MPRRKARPRARRGEGSVYTRSDGRVVATLLIASGQRRAYYGRTEAEAREKRDAAAAHLAAGVDLARAQQPLSEYLPAWHAACVAPRLSPRTIALYRHAIRAWLVPTLGRVRVDQLRTADVDRALATMVEWGLAPRSIATARSVLVSAYQQAMRWDLVLRNPASLSRAPHVSSAATIPPAADLYRVLEALRDHPLHALFRTQLALAIRQGEARGLRWQDIDWQARRVTIAVQCQKSEAGVWELVPLKATRQRRRVWLSAPLEAILRSRLAEQRRQRLACGPDWQEHGVIFTTATGGLLPAGTAERAWQRAAQRVGLRHTRPHHLRHLAATEMRAHGIPDRVIMEQLGHSSIGITMDIYTSVRDAAMEEAADVLGRLVDGRGSG